MIKDFNELEYGQQVTIKGYPGSIYYGCKGKFMGMSSFFGADVAVIQFLKPKPLHYSGGRIDSDVIFLHEIEI